MSFCAVLRVRDGIVALADSSVSEAGERRRVRNLTLHEVAPGRHMALMTAGERAMRDRALALFEDEMQERDTVYRRIHKAVDAFGGRIRQVTGDVRASGGPEDGLPFEALLAGRLEDDDEPEAYLLENDGLWIEIDEDTPYRVVGRTRFATPLLDQALTFHTSLDDAVKIACLAAEATARAAVDVAYPLDVALLPRRGTFLQRRLERADVEALVAMWNQRIRATVADLPSPWPATAGFDRRVIV